MLIPEATSFKLSAFEQNFLSGYDIDYATSSLQERRGSPISLYMFTPHKMVLRRSVAVSPRFLYGCPLDAKSGSDLESHSY